MEGHDHVLEFKAAKKNGPLKDWISEIRKHIEKSDGHVQQKKANGIEGAWKSDNMTEKLFKKEA